MWHHSFPTFVVICIALTIALLSKVALLVRRERQRYRAMQLRESLAPRRQRDITDVGEQPPAPPCTSALLFCGCVRCAAPETPRERAERIERALSITTCTPLPREMAVQAHAMSYGELAEQYDTGLDPRRYHVIHDETIYNGPPLPEPETAQEDHERLREDAIARAVACTCPDTSPVHRESCPAVANDKHITVVSYKTAAGARAELHVNTAKAYAKAYVLPLKLAPNEEREPLASYTDGTPVL